MMVLMTKTTTHANGGSELAKSTVYFTTEQLHRMSGLACDALVGLQVDADDSDNTAVNGCFVSLDDPQVMKFFSIDPDGTLEVTT